MGLGVSVVEILPVVGDLRGDFSFAIDFRSVLDVSARHLQNFRIDFPEALGRLFNHEWVNLVMADPFSTLEALQFSFCEKFISDAWRATDLSKIADQKWGTDWRQNSDTTARSLAIHGAKTFTVNLSGADFHE